MGHQPRTQDPREYSAVAPDTRHSGWGNNQFYSDHVISQAMTHRYCRVHCHLDLDASVIGTAAAKAGPYAKQGRSHSPISVPRQNMSSHKAGPARVDSGIYYLSQSVLLFITTTPAKNNQKSQITYFTSVRTAGPGP